MKNGILNVYKEKGYTSHDVVAKLRGILKQKKIGHTGTLDPDAEGVLPVCAGSATKLCDMLTERDKAYRTTLLLGKTTDTQDISGTILNESDAIPTEEEVRRVIEHFVGPYAQVPPMYSALKVNGKKLYELAREGKTIERAARNVQIHEISIEKIELPRVIMTVSCSKGTYIRTLCHDIGTELGCGGCMETLMRIQSGVFKLEDTKTLAQIENACREGMLDDLLIPVDRMFAHLSEIQTKPEFDKMIYNGNPVFLSQIQLDRPEKKEQEVEVRVYDSRHVFCGIYHYRKEKGGFWPVKMFLS